MSEATLTVTCNYCGLENSITGSQGPLEMLNQLDQVHDILRPGCKATLDRAAAVVGGEQHG